MKLKKLSEVSLYGKMILEDIHCWCVEFQQYPSLLLWLQFLSLCQKVGKSYSVFKCGSSHQRYCMIKGVHRNFAKFTGKYLRQSLFFKKETLAQVFSCEFSEISRNTFSYKAPLVKIKISIDSKLKIAWFEN